MSEDEEPEQDKKEETTLPGGIPLPPPPQAFQPNPENMSPTYGSSASPLGKPLGPGSTPHPKLRRVRKGRFWGCLATLIIALLALVAVLIYLGPGRYVAKGFQIVNVSDLSEVTEAPETPSCYLASGSLHYKVPATKVPVVLIAKEILVEGDFYEDVALTAVKVSATTEARFAKNLEVNTLEFSNQGITLKGGLKGRIGKTLTPAP